MKVSLHLLIFKNAYNIAYFKCVRVIDPRERERERERGRERERERERDGGSKRMR